VEAEAPDPEPARRSRRLWLAVGGVVAAGIAAFLAFGVFGVQTLFTDDEVNESGPTFDSGAQSETTVATDPETIDPKTTDPEAETTVATTAPVPQVRTVATGSFTGVDHPGAGSVTLLSDGSQTFVRFENDFATDNGPDLFAVAYVGDERIELGVLKGNQGAQNYELPAEIDPNTVTTIAVWCKRFDSTFTEAALT
jgi:hypothetical protein